MITNERSPFFGIFPQACVLNSQAEEGGRDAGLVTNLPNIPQELPALGWQDKRVGTKKQVKATIPLDPITSLPLKDPIIAPNGITYSRASFWSYLRDNKDSVLSMQMRSVAPNACYINRVMQERTDVDRDAGAEFKDDLCPITLGSFEDPVVASDGHTYELRAIREQFQRTGISPVTREKLQPFVYRNQAFVDFLRSRKPGTALSYKQLPAKVTLLKLSQAGGSERIQRQRQVQIVNAPSDEHYCPSVLSSGVAICVGGYLGAMGAGTYIIAGNNPPVHWASWLIGGIVIGGVLGFGFRLGVFKWAGS